MVMQLGDFGLVMHGKTNPLGQSIKMQHLSKIAAFESARFSKSHVHLASMELLVSQEQHGSQDQPGRKKQQGSQDKQGSKKQHGSYDQHGSK